MSQLKLEIKDQGNETVQIGGLMLTPYVNEAYWQFRVLLNERQAIVGFPKFGTIGVGFAVEEDWNTNFPFTCSTDEIFEHIKHNKGDDAISDEDVKTAIMMVKQLLARLVAEVSLRDAARPPHPLVAAILEVTPIDPDDGTVIVDWHPCDCEDPDCTIEVQYSTWGDPASVAARQAVAALRWMYDHVSYAGDAIRIRREADEIEAGLPACPSNTEETTTA